MRQAEQAGFTLLELLIAMTLLGFLLALLFAGMRLGSRSWDAGELRTTNSTHLALVQGFLRRELNQIDPYRWKQKPTPELAFQGDPDKLRFVAPIAVRLGPGGLYLVSLELTRGQGAEGGQLIMKRVIPEVDSSDFSALDNVSNVDAKDGVVVLAEQVEAVNFSYFGAETREAEPQWQDKWDNQKVLPYLIRLRVKFSNGRYWPDLVASPLIGISTGCMWDNKLNRCAN